MPNSLQPLQPLSGPVNTLPGMTPEVYEATRRRQVMADALVADARNPSDASGSMLGAIGQGLKGYAGASMQQQNAATLAGYGQSSPAAVSALQPAQPVTIRSLADGFGSFFGRASSFLNGGSSSAQPGLLTPDPDNRAAAGVTSTPEIGADRRWRDDDDA